MLPGTLRNPGRRGSVAPVMRIDIWSDVICPYCWIGKRHLETALATFREDHPDVPVDVVWRAYELDAGAPVVTDEDQTETAAQMLSRKYRMPLAEAEAAQEQMAASFAELGLSFDWRSARICSTFDSHRLAALAAEHGVSDAVDEGMRRAHFSEGRAISDPAVLRDIAAAAGLPGEEVDRVLDGNAYSEDVRRDIETARQIGVRGVPFFVFDSRVAVSGAQPVEVFTQALERAVEVDAG